ncbi:MAG: glycosyltransferase family 4 protein [bacterium]
MKIIYVSNAKIPSKTANSIHIMKICQAFSKKGHEVILVAPEYKDIEVGVDDVYGYYGVDNIFKIIKLPWKRIKGRGYIYGWEVAIVVSREKPDLVYGRSLTSCYFSSIITKVPIIFEAHQPIKDFGMIQEFCFRKLLKKQSFEKFVVISDSLKQYYIKNYNMKSEKILVAHDGADCAPENIKLTKLQLIDNEKINVGYIGHLYKGKGMELISKLAKKCSWANFHVVGGLEQDINYWKKELDGVKNIYFYGFVPHSKTLCYGKAFDVLLAPYQKKVSGYGNKKANLSDWMSPLKIFEYMSLGKPIVCSDLPVLREILKNNYNGLLCDPENIDEWVKALKDLVADKKLTNRIGSQGKKDFLEKYTWDKRAELVLSNSKKGK